MSQPKTALITGASSGIGAELAKLFAAGHYQLILVARREDRLNQLAQELESQHKTTVNPIVADLSKIGAAERLYHQLNKQPIDCLINNAGFGNFNDFVNIDLITDRHLLQLNMITLTELTKLCLPIMIERRQGHILNVASTAAFQPGPYMATYFASKAYVLSLSEALAHELKPHGINISCLCPGTTATEFFEKAHMHNSLLTKSQMMSAADVAKIAYHGMMRGKRLIIPGWKNKLLAQISQLAPRKLATAAAAFLNKQRQPSSKQ